eukprot:6178722-Pleurochrysis_carterae.AAC.1
MEPVMKVEVTVPEESMGDVIGDINSRRATHTAQAFLMRGAAVGHAMRGMVAELAERGNMKVVRARVPLSNMFQYVSQLRSITKGRASYSMELDNYEVVPPNVEKELLTKYKGNTEEDD